MLKKKRGVPLWKRILAYIIDAIVVSFIIAVPLKTFKADGWADMQSWTSITEGVTAPFGEAVKMGVIVAIITILYWALMEYYIKQSLGKMVFRLEVRSTKKNLTFKQCLIRNVTKIDGVILFLDTLYLIVKKKNQRFFEKISETEVVSK